MTVSLSLGCKAYPWVEPLIDGEVSPTAIDLSVLPGHVSPVYFDRLLRSQEIDVAELSLGSYLAAMEIEDDFQVSAIPVFLHRRFRHGFVYVQAGSDIETPADLNGATIGLPNWQFAAGVWVKGILADHHGLDLQSVEWVTSGREIVPLSLSSEFDVADVSMRYDAPLEAGGTGALKTLQLMLEDGTIDAVITPTEYRSDGVERLFSDPYKRERSYFEETGVFPIMHLVAIRDDVLADHPWIANELYDAFLEAMERRVAEYTEQGWFKRSPLVWSLEAIESQLEAFDGNPWEYGLTEYNRRTLETGIRYAAAQDIIGEPMPVEDLFISGVGQNPFLE
jgi:4,5-dihydroxyphthalate decarboxylase